MATLKQMLCRSNGDHASVLRCLETGKKLMYPNRGHLTCLRTLRRWGCVDNNGITPVGRQLLAEYRAANWASAGRASGPDNDNDDSSVEWKGSL